MLDYFSMQRVISHGVWLSLIFYSSTSEKKCLEIPCSLSSFQGNIIWTCGTYACWARYISLFIIWLSPRAGKMNQIARCDWLPERARWSHLARSGLPAVSRMKNFPESLIINPLLTKFVPSRWLDIGLVLVFASLWTSTSSRSINTQKKNLANIQPS